MGQIMNKISYENEIGKSVWILICMHLDMIIVHEWCITWLKNDKAWLNMSLDHVDAL